MGKISKGLSLRSRPLQSPSRASPVPALPRGSPGAVRGCPPAPGPTLAHIPLPGGRAGGTAGSLAPCPPSPCLPHVQGEAARSSPSLGLVSRQQPRSSSPGSEPRRASSCASHMPAIAARCRAAGEPLAFSLPQDRGAQASRRARRFPGTCSRLSPREHTALLSGEEKSLARMFPLRQAGCLQAVAGLEMEASALCARGAACSTRGSPAPPAGVSPRAPQARRAGSTHVCTGISGLAEGTLFFPVGAGCSPGAAGRFKSSGC